MRAIGTMMAVALVSGSAWAQATKMALLVPDTSRLSDPALQVWMDGIEEQGYEVVPYANAQFLSDGQSTLLKFRGVIVPDEAQRKMSDALVASIKQYVALGGRLMLVYDAGVLNDQGTYPANGGSRFSDLVGVEYASYGDLRERMAGSGPVTGTVQSMRALLVPPGKSAPYALPQDGNAKVYVSKVLALSQGGNDEQRPLAALENDPDDAYLASAETDASQVHAIAGYGYGVLSYSSFVTRGAFPGHTLLTSPAHGLVAGVRRYGKGQVLFANLSLSGLKRRTDGLLLHGFVDYFARRMVGVPQMSQAPAGTGGLILNWHLDSMAAQSPTLQLKERNVFKHGPFSIHITAGPDNKIEGDGLGWNLPSNPVAQALLREFDRAGHQVGNHGGWVHDYYGLHANDANGAEFQKYLELNDAAVRAAIGHKVSEYSAPVGTNPQWALDWLESQGIRAFYSLGHSGMGPTRSWRDGVLRNPSMWTMPIVSYNDTATFEEWQRQGLPKQEIMAWYKALVAFASNKSAVRQIYAHPPGALLWVDVLEDLLKTAQQAGKTKNGFRWYTETAMANHMTRRLKVKWSTSRTAQGAIEVSASHADTLSGVAWSLKKAWYAKPTIKSGSATIAETKTDWLVRAANVKALTFQVREAPHCGGLAKFIPMWPCASPAPS